MSLNGSIVHSEKFVMSNTNEFKRELSKIAEKFSLEVIKLIQKMSVSQLAAISSGKAVARVTV